MRAVRLLDSSWGNLITYGFFRYGMIEELFVKKEFRNRGIGRSLVREILNRFKRLKAEVVLVTTEGHAHRDLRPAKAI